MAKVNVGDAAPEFSATTDSGATLKLSDLRGKRVVTTGMPFYAGWGLTQDMFPQPARRRARPTLAALAHAVLIAYPRYVDPVSGLICPPEVAVERLAKGEVPEPGRWNRGMSKLQGLFAGRSWLWR